MTKFLHFSVFVITLIIVASCANPVTSKPTTGKEAETDPSTALSDLKIYDDISAAGGFPLPLEKDVNSKNNATVANIGASKIFIEAVPAAPAGASISVKVGIVSGFELGLTAPGIPFATPILIELKVTASGSEESSTYKITVAKNPEELAAPDRELSNDPLGGVNGSLLYYNGVNSPLLEDGTPNEEYGYKTLTAVLQKIKSYGVGTEAAPDVVYLGGDIDMDVSASIVEGMHVKLVSPPLKKYTIKRKKEDGFLNYMFMVGAGSSLTFEAMDGGGGATEAADDDKVGSRLILDGGAIWTGMGTTPVSGTNISGATNAFPLVFIDGGTFNMNKWVVLQNNDFGTTGGESGIAVNITNQGVFNMYGGEIIQNRGKYGTVRVNDGGAAYIYDGLFQSNYAASGGNGGVFHVNDAYMVNKLYIYGGAFIGNKSDGIGGVAYAHSNCDLRIGPKSIWDSVDDGSNPDVSSALDAIEVEDWNNVQVSAEESVGLTAGQVNRLYAKKAKAADVILFKDNASVNHGGAICYDLHNFDGPKVFCNIILENNTAQKYYGGGLYYYDDRGADGGGVHIQNVLAKGNSIVNGNHGGGVYLDAPDVATVKKSIFSGNKTNGYGGGLCLVLKSGSEFPSIIENCEFTGNSSDCGGGLDVEFRTSSSPLLDVKESNFKQNKANWGGGIYIRGIGTYNFIGTETNPIRVEENVGYNGGGGINTYAACKLNADWLIVSGNRQTTASTDLTRGGGGFRIEAASENHFANTTVSGNIAKSGKGGGGFLIFNGGNVNFESGIIGGPPLPNGEFNLATANYAYELGAGVALHRTSATSGIPEFTLGAGASVEGNGMVLEDGKQLTTQWGGGLGSYSTGKYTLFGAVKNNKASLGGGGIHINAGAFVNTFNLTLESGSEVSGNSVVGRDYDNKLNTQHQYAGGGLNLYNGNKNADFLCVIKNGAIISGNSARRGGGILAMNIRKKTDSNNNVTAGLVMEGGEISGNKAEIIMGAGGPGETGETQGGGVLLSAQDSDFTTYFLMKGGVIKENEAISKAAYGGGVHLNQNSTFDMVGGTIENNKSEYGGGGVSILSNSAAFNLNGADALLKENVAHYGGGVYVSRITVSYTNVLFNYTFGRFQANQAVAAGGFLPIPAGASYPAGFTADPAGHAFRGQSGVMSGAPDGAGGLATAVSGWQVFTHDSEDLVAPPYPAAP
ncbi:MAG: hypothetical protein LBC53_02380 [Spirochaetaceae bacterium]|jgi:hypothetical protein|nr:hypothetical protein [Spirochaetaceae bacterium]